MAKTIFDSTARSALLARLDHLQATAPARWGKFTAPKMVSHLVQAALMALGDVPVKPRRGPLRYRPVRWLVIYVLPWPKGTPTAPEMLSRAPQSWPADIAALKALIERASANGAAGRWASHPAFGDLSGADWGALIHRHVSHHLTQFGV